MLGLQNQPFPFWGDGVGRGGLVTKPKGLAPPVFKSAVGAVFKPNHSAGKGGEAEGCHGFARSGWQIMG